jgi:HAD superfamily hydrolase (TIGR01509 family)
MELEKWFDPDKLVYSDGSFRGKPHPDIFIKAIDKLRVKAEDIIIFEDSPAGIQAAQSSGAGEIIIVNSDNGNYASWPYQVITNFLEVKLK